MKKTARLPISLLLLCSIVFFTTNSVHAASPKTSGSLEVDPAYLEVTLAEKDSEQVFQLFYTNHSTEQLQLELFPIDFKQATDKGGISFLGKDANTYSYSLSSFLTFEANQVTIDPGEKRPFTVRVTNRQDLSPGGHYAAVVARVVAGGSDKMNVSPALSSLIYMKKMGGERYSLSVTGVDWPQGLLSLSIPQTTEMTFQNEGNIHVVPYGRAEVKDMFGRLLYKGIVNTSSVILMPETRRLLPLELKKINQSWPISINSFTINGSDSLQKTHYVYQETFLYIHPLVLLVLGVILIGCILICLKRRKQRHLHHPVSPVEPKHEQAQILPPVTQPERKKTTRRKKK